MLLWAPQDLSMRLFSLGFTLIATTIYFLKYLKKKYEEGTQTVRLSGANLKTRLLKERQKPCLNLQNQWV